MGKKMLHLPPLYHKYEDHKTGSTETKSMGYKMEEYEMHAIEVEDEEADELRREIGRIFHQELDMGEKEADGVGAIWWKAIRYLADIVLSILIMLLPILMSIMAVGFLIKGGKVFLCRLTDLWRKTGKKRNF